MQTLILYLLAFFARAIIKKHNPYIIGITGTVGKTTQTTYITKFLREIYGESQVGSSKYHYNGEYGLPLTIIGAKTGGKNPILWLGVFYTAIGTYFRPYPKYLILEYGIDHDGEMEFLLSIAKPHIAIVTPIAPNHLEQFGTLENYRKAKLLLPNHARENAIIHEGQQEYIAGENISFYGKKIGTQWHVHSAKQTLTSLDIEVMIDGEKYSLSLPVFGEYQAENILPLFAIADHLGIDKKVIGANAHLFVPESGRSNILTGYNGSTIIDGSYNGGYESISKGLESLLPFQDSHRIICFLGDMRELGIHTEKIHRELAQFIVQNFHAHSHIHFFLVGKEMEKYVAPILEKTFPTYTTKSSRDAGKKIHTLLSTEKKETIIYLKGSQNTIFLEEGMKEFLAHESDTKNLCRQSRDWMKKKEKYFSTLH